uniref:Uncharacterized protein n=1 Tax=viral metagenome TaxID=1070528 RepID=A0A6M3JTH3_9ZZZZ
MPKNAGDQESEAKAISSEELADDKSWVEENDDSPPADEAESPESTEEVEERPEEAEAEDDTSEEGDQEEGTEEKEETEPEKSTEEAVDYKVLYETEKEKAESKGKRVGELETALGRQGRELGEQREVARKRFEDFGESRKRVETQFLETYGMMLENAELAEDGITKARIKSQAEMLRTTYENNNLFAYRQHGNDNEQAVLSVEGNEKFSSVKDKFEDFCLEIGHNPIEVKLNPDTISKYYQVLLDRERGKPENIEALGNKAKEAALESASRKKNKAGPDASSSTKTVSKAVPKDTGWPDLGSERSGALE